MSKFRPRQAIPTEPYILDPCEKRAIEALIPLIVDDGPLHKTSSLPNLTYTTPLHLDYTCSCMADQTFPKLERLRVIGRVVHLHTVSYGKVKRFKTWQGKTPAWVIEFIDPLARMAGAGCFWALRGDEYAIVKQWQAYLSRIIFPTDLRCTDGGASVMEGRFRRRYSSKEKYESAIQDAIQAIKNAGFDVIHTRADTFTSRRTGVETKDG